MKIDFNALLGYKFNKNKILKVWIILENLELERELKKVIIEVLELEYITCDDINSEEALFVDGLGLDSIDALELGMALKKRYNLVLGTNKEENKKHFFSVKTLADFISSQKNKD